jgi:hypothetical protein
LHPAPLSAAEIELENGRKVSRGGIQIFPAPLVAATGLIPCKRAGRTLKVRQVARHVGAGFRRWANLRPRLDGLRPTASIMKRVR